MKNLLLLLIKIYWRIIPPPKRRTCIFRISCSKYVYEKTKADGWVPGIKALKYRFQNCGSGACIIENPTGETYIILPNQQILKESEISARFIKNKRKNHGKVYNHPKS